MSPGLGLGDDVHEPPLKILGPLRRALGRSPPVGLLTLRVCPERDLAVRLVCSSFRSSVSLVECKLGKRTGFSDLPTRPSSDT